MSSLYSFNNIGYGTSRYQLGLDGTQIPEQKKEAGFFSGMGEAALDILPAAGNSTLAAGLDLLGSFMRSEPNEDESGFTLEDALPSDDIMKAQDLKEQAAQKFETKAKERRSVVREDYTPKPETTGMAGQILYGFGVMGLKQLGYSVISGLNPIGGAILTGVDYGVNEAGNLRDKGVKPEVATKAGITSGVMTAGGLLLPGAAPAGKFNPSRLTSAAWGAGANAVMDSGEKGIINYILQNANYSDIAKEYDPFDVAGLTASAGIGGIMGLILFNKNRRIKFKPAKKAEEKTDPIELNTETLESLQNRDRSTNASVRQMKAISANPQYTLLRTSPFLSEGAPVITYAGDIPAIRRGHEDTAASGDKSYKVYYAVVEADSVLVSNDVTGHKNPAYTDPNIQGPRAIAGNGRIAGLQDAYAQGTADKYKADLAADQRRTGIYGDEIARMEKPILVRVLDPKDVTKDLADKTNTSGVSRMSLRERAKNDAERVDLEKLEFDEDGRITDQTVVNFIKMLPAEEQAELIDSKSGKANKTARDRAEAAIFAKAYKNDTLINLVTEVDKPEARLVLKALMELAPKVAQLEGNKLDITPSIIRAASKILEGYKKGFKLKDIAAQKEFDEDPYADAIVELFAKDSRTNRHVVDVLGEHLDSLRESGNADQGSFDLLGGPLTREDALKDLQGRIANRYPTPNEAVVDAARTKQVADTINKDQLVSEKAGDMNQSIENEYRAQAQIDDGERVSVNENAVDQARVEQEKARIIEAMHKVQKEAEGDPLEILAKIEPEDVQGMTIRRGWFARTNKKEAQAAEMSTPFGLVKVWLKHDKGEEKPELRVTDDDLRQIPRIVRGYEPIPRSHEKETSRTWRVMHNGRELVLVDKPMEGDPTGKTLLSFFVQDPAKRETGRAKGAPLSRLRNPAPEVEGPSTDTNARLSIFSSRPSGPSNDGVITTHGPKTDTSVKTNLTDGIEQSQEVRDATQGTNDAVQTQQNVVNQVVNALPEEVREPIKRVVADLTGERIEPTLNPQPEVGREFSLEAQYETALRDHPDMKITIEDENGGTREMSAADLLDEADREAKQIENDGKAQGEAMMCVVKNKGIN